MAQSSKYPFSFSSTSGADTKRGLLFTSLLVLNFTFCWYICCPALSKLMTYCCLPALNGTCAFLSAR